MTEQEFERDLLGFEIRTFVMLAGRRWFNTRIEYGTSPVRDRNSMLAQLRQFNADRVEHYVHPIMKEKPVSDTKLIQLELTRKQRLLLRYFLDGAMRDTQGDGTFDDEADDELVLLNDKIDAALKQSSTGG